MFEKELKYVMKIDNDFNDRAVSECRVGEWLIVLLCIVFWMYLLLFNKIDFFVIKMLIEVESFMSLFIFTEYDTFDSDDDEDDCDDDTCIDDGGDDDDD